MLFSSLPFLLLLFLIKTKSKPKPKLNLPPGPPPLPFIGNFRHLRKPIHLSLHHLSRTHGPILYLTLGHVPFLVVSTPSLAEQVLKTHDLALCSRPPLVSSRLLTFNFSDVAFAPYDHHWRNLRKIFILELLGSKKLPSHSKVREQECVRMISSIKTDSVINLSEYILRVSNSILTRVALGFTPKGE